MGTSKGVSIGTSNADSEGATAIVKKYRNLLKKTKRARVGQIILSGILPVIRGSKQRIHELEEDVDLQNRAAAM